MKSIGMKLSLAAALLAGVAVTTGGAYADDAPAAPSWGTLSAYVAVASDYRFRGISQDDKNPSPEASINWTGPDGFYAGTWLAKTNWTSVATCPTCGASPTFEMDLYAGKHFDLGGTDLNVEAYYYSYPDANSAVLGTTKATSYYETIVQLSHAFGPLTPEHVRELLLRLDAIEETVNQLRVPASFASQFYELRGHIAFVRRRLETAHHG